MFLYNAEQEKRNREEELVWMISIYFACLLQRFRETQIREWMSLIYKN